MKTFFKSILEWELTALARTVLRRFRPYIVGITGSSGKTTTKYMIGELLRAVRNKTYVSEGNLNTEIGLPMAVLGYKKAPENILDFISVFFGAPFRALFLTSYSAFAVFEYAADKPGDMEKLTSIAAPDIAVITNIGVAHIGAFKSVEKIAQEKWKFAQMAKDFVVCDDDVLKKTKEFNQPRAKVVLTGNIETAMAKDIKYQTNKATFDFYLTSKKYQTEFGFLGEHLIRDLELSVLAVHLATGESEKILKQVESLKPQVGRGERILGRRDILILDESYNANPLSMLAALEVLRSIKYGRKVAILGQMSEIEPIADKAHLEVADRAKKIADLTVGVGEGFKSAKLDKWYPNVEELGKEIEEILHPGDVVLLKGSHFANHLERLVEKLK